jgi:ABC-type transport system involved in multi-copper enzyme maturation permease subunit
MFGIIFGFELRYRFKRIATYVYFLIMLLTGFLYGAIMAGGFGAETALALTGGGRNMANSPFNLHQIILTLGQFPGLFIIAAFMGLPVYRDFQYNAHSLFFTKPITKSDYLLGRFLGSTVITLFSLFGLLIGLALAFVMPFADEARVAPFNAMHYLWPFLTQVVPFTLFCGTIFFATVSLSRNQLFIYLNAILILVLFSIAGVLAQQVENKTIAALLDPSGASVFANTTEKWTVPDRNSLMVPVTGLYWGYLAIWMGVAAAICALTFRYFKFAHGALSLVFGKKKLVEAVPLIGDTLTFQQVNLPEAKRLFTFGNDWSLMWRLARLELRNILKSPIFWVIVFFAVLMAMITQFVGAGTVFGTPTLPVTYQIAGSISGLLGLFNLALIVFYSGELVWRERGLRIDQIYSATPAANWSLFGGKALALFALPVLLQAIGIVCGVLVQAFKGYFKFELDVYAGLMLVYELPQLFQFAALALLVQVLSPNKFLGFFLSAALFFVFGGVLSNLGLEHPMWRYMSGTQVIYSDMNGFGHFVGPYWTFTAYWSCIAVLMLVVANAIFPRATEGGPQAVWRRLKAHFNRPALVTSVVSTAAFLGLGGYIYYNTYVLNEFTGRKEATQLQVNFEKKYKKYDGANQPKITGVNIRVDLMPETRDIDMKGFFWLKNKSDRPIDSVIVNVSTDVDWKQIGFDRPSDRVLEDEEYGFYIFKLGQPLAAGDSLKLEFTGELRTNGFPAGGFNNSVVANGTFINHGYFPSIGYSSDFEIQEEDIRKKNGLADRPRFPAIDDTVAVNRTLFASDADWVDFECVVTTAPDQIAVAPGYLQREWTENGRRAFHYKMDSKMAKFYAIVSGRFEVKKDSWTAPDGREIALEIYHHPSHDRNLDRMMDAMKKSLAYYTEAFGPYQHRQARILEFPRYAGFAQSFANTIPYSESVGFIADVKEGDVDYPFYITAHELAHQWWAHQVVGGYVQGFQFLSETMSQYASLMVMEDEFGQEEIKKYLRYELDNYLTGRATESREELPVLLSENQLYIHYNKGSLVMYALKDYLGEDSLNAALKRYVSKVKFQSAPFTTTTEWMQYVSAVTPDSLKSTVNDLLYKVTVYNNSMTDASYVKVDDQYEVRMKVASKKTYMEGMDEKDVPVRDYLDVGVYGRVKADGKWKDTLLYLNRHLIQADTQEVVVRVSQQPERAGIDPLNKMIDLKPDDNLAKVKSSEKK